MFTKKIVSKDNSSFTPPKDIRDQLLHDAHFETSFRTVVANLNNKVILDAASRYSGAIGLMRR